MNIVRRICSDQQILSSVSTGSANFRRQVRLFPNDIEKAPEESVRQRAVRREWTGGGYALDMPQPTFLPSFIATPQTLGKLV